MKNITLSTVFALCAISLTAQFNIGTNKTNTKVVLQIVSADSTQTMIIPITNDTDRPAAEASLRGSLVYNTTDSTVQYCTGTQWLELSPSAGGGNIYDANGTLTGARVVTMSGNDLTFDGTGDVIIKDDGNVGIGTTSPIGKLQVQIDQDASIDSVFYVGNDGRVGIGTANPMAPLQLDIRGTGYTRSYGPLNPYFMAHDTTNDTRIKIQALDNYAVVGTESAHDLQIYTGNSVKAIVTNTGNVGIGTISPAEKLSVVETVDAKQTATIKGANTGTGTGFYSQLGIVNTNSSANTIVGVELNHSNAANAEKTAASLEATLNDVTSGAEQGNLRINTMTSGTVTEKMRIDAAGNVGIGTTSPTRKLQVQDGSSLLYNPSGNAIESYGYSHFERAGELIGLRETTNAISSLGAIAFERGDGSGNDMHINTIGDGANGISSLSITDGTTDHFVVQHGGNVGIGTTSPLAKLNIKQSASNTNAFRIDFDANLTSIGSGNSLVFVNDNGDDNSWTGAVDAYHKSRNSGSFVSSGRSGWQLQSDVGGLINSDYVIATATNNTAPTEKVRVTSEGNVGIGTTTPTAQLEVIGPKTAGSESLLLRNGNDKLFTADRVQLAFGFDNTTNYKHYITSGHSSLAAGNSLNFYTSDGTAAGTYPANAVHNMTMDNGNVGIGTTSPDEKLHVAGSIKMVDGNQAAGKVLTSDANGVASWQTTSGGGSVDGDAWGVTGEDQTAAIGRTGNVGIGTSNPTYKLHIEDGNAIIRNGGKEIGFFPNLALGGSQIHSYDRTNSVYTNLQLKSNELKIQNSASIDILTALDNGNVGIGTTSPDEKLHVAGSIKIVDGNQAAGKVLTSDANGVASWQTASGGGSADGDAWGVTGENQTAAIGRTGNVAIGKASPSFPLDVVGDIKIDGAANGYVGIRQNNNSNLIIGSSSGSEPRAYFHGSASSASPGDIHLIAANQLTDNIILLGKTGVGLTNPSVDLQVDGSFISGATTNTATGSNSVVIGGSGNSSTAVGSISGGANSDATGNYALAIGNNITASGTASATIGYNSTASANYSYTLGSNCHATGTYSAAIGFGDSAVGTTGGAWAIGNGCDALGNVSLATGTGTRATGIGSTAMGGQTKAEGNYSMAVGFQTEAKGGNSFASGYRTEAHGNATAMGYQSKAITNHSIALGFNDSASGGAHGAYAFGYGNKAMANVAVAIGSSSQALHTGSMALGNSSVTDANGQMAASFYGGYKLYSNLARTTGVQLAANGGTWSSISDRRAKKNIKGLSYGLEEIIKLKPSIYNYKDGGKTKSLGFIAQEMNEVIPEVVEVPENEDEMMSIRYTELIPVLTKAIQELDLKIKALEIENTTLKSENSTLKSGMQEMNTIKDRLSHIEKLLGDQSLNR